MKKLLIILMAILPFQIFAQTEQELIHSLMDQWHLAAAKADSATFFGSFTQQGIYIGTDTTEYWTRDEMAAWASPYFKRESAWDFTSISREVYFSEDGNTAWIHEKLNTWMGVCKGTAVLVKLDNNWKIALYDLSVTIDNDKIKKFLELIKED